MVNKGLIPYKIRLKRNKLIMIGTKMWKN